MGKHKITLSILAVVLCLGLWFGFGAQAEASTSSSVLENENFKLQLVNDYSELQLTDKQTGTVWTSSMNDPLFDNSKVSAKWKKKMASLFTVNVTNLKRGFGTVATFDLAGTPYTAEEYQTADGIGVKYDLSDPAIRLAVEFALTEDGVDIRIPNESIEEYGETFSITSVDLMMFFGARADGQDGYFFYPDGSGAIMRFDDKSHVNETTVIYDVYGDIIANEELLGLFEDADPKVLMPVFGGNYGAEGYVAYITEGAESSKITITPSAKIIKANYMYPSFTYRRSFLDPRVTAKTVQTFDAEKITIDYAIHYSVLPVGESEYADMAAAYREYLVESGAMSKPTADDSFTLALDLFMGIKEEGLIFDTFQSVTNFEQAQEILEDLTASIDGNVDATLVGWTNGGFGSEPKFFPASWQLGGNSGLKKLAQYTDENGIDLTLAANFLTVDAEASGYSKNNDIVFLSNYQALTNKRESLYLISPNIALNNFNKFMKKAEKYPVSGLKLDNVGTMMYYNYTEKNVVTSNECQQYWKDMMQAAKDATGSVTVDGGNAYALGIADKVTQIPVEDCGYQMTTEAVPFYQIVAHGYVDYTGEALNLSSDSERQQLKWIEYGYLPYFEITYESAEKLINTRYSELFSSAYSAWKDEILETYTMLEDALKDVRNEEIISHEKVAEDVYCTGYANGTEIYVNYNSSAVTVNGVDIDARSYKVMGGN